MRFSFFVPLAHNSYRGGRSPLGSLLSFSLLRSRTKKRKGISRDAGRKGGGERGTVVMAGAGGGGGGVGG